MQRWPHRPFAGHGRPARQRGAVAIMVALALVVLVGFVGLAIDGGHLYLTKTELQNSADACALAASYEFTNPTTLTPMAYTRAVAAGQAVALKNRVNFQGAALVAGNVGVTFGADLKSGTSWATATAAGSASPRPAYVRCTLTRPGIAMFFMSVMGFGAQTASSLATAALVPSQSTCAVPIGLCTNGSTTTPFGLTAPYWTSNLTPVTFTSYNGSLDWSGLMAGNGACSLDTTQTVGTGNITGNNGHNDGGGNGGYNGGGSGNGKKTAGADAWNTRLGIYSSASYSLSSAPPDFTGAAYTSSGGGNVLANFFTQRSNNASYPSGSTTQAQYQTYGADRRLVVVPVVDCSKLVKNNDTTAIVAWGCALIVQPMSGSTMPAIEYEGLASAAGSPCASSGLPGASTSTGSMVPALVQ